MYTTQLVKRLRDEYNLELCGKVKVPDGREGMLLNVRLDPDAIGVVQFIKDKVYTMEKFNLEEIKSCP